MASLSPEARRMLGALALLHLLVLVVAAIYYRSAAVMPFTAGLLLALSANALRVFLLDTALRRANDMANQPESEKARMAAYLQGQYLLRYLLSGLTLVAAVFLPFVELWGAICGFLVWPLTTFVMRVWESRRTI